jgi:uncharacterized phage protein gp47/JayE
MSFGLTLTGFNRKRLADSITELDAAYRATFGADILTAGDSVFGQMIGIAAEREAEIWELAEAVFYSAFPDTAEGVALANTVALTGHAPLPATYSTVTVTATGTPGTLLSAGRIVSVPGTGARFLTLADATIAGGGTVDIACQAEVTGPVEAEPATLTQIDTPVAGWASVTNATAAATGRNAETDPELRVRRAENLTVAQGGTAEAMEARVLEVADVEFVGVKENRTNATNGDGLPPKSIQVFVIGGADAAVAQKIWDTKPAGIETYGSESEVVTDSLGNAQTVYFERGTAVPMYLDVNLTTDSAFPADGNAQVQAALLAYGATLANGDDVVNWRLMAALAEIPGITAVTIYQGTAPAPASAANTAISASQLATFDASRITF